MRHFVDLGEGVSCGVAARREAHRPAAAAQSNWRSIRAAAARALQSGQLRQRQMGDHEVDHQAGAVDDGCDHRSRNHGRVNASVAA